MQDKYLNSKITAILILALFVRLLGISSRPIWYDEAFAILFSEKGFSAMLYGTLAPTGIGSADIHPLGYYTVLSLWMKVFGESLVAARSLSILAGVASVYLIYLIALEATADSGTAYLSMIIATLAPFQVHYAQEIRMYAFLAFWLLLATYSYQRTARDGKWNWCGLFSVSAALAQYSHNLAAFYLIPLALLPVLQKNWQALRAMILAGIGALILYSPWLVQLPAQFTKVQNSYWVERPDLSKLITLLLVYTTNTPIPAQWIGAALSVALVSVGIGVLQTVRNARRPATRDGLWLLYLSFAPALLLFLFSQWKPVYVERALLPSAGIFCIWLAWVTTKTNLTRIAQFGLVSLVAVAAVLGIYQHLTYHDFPYGPFKELNVSLRERVVRAGVIVHSNKLSMLPSRLFDRELSQSFIGDEPGSSTDTLAAATQAVLQVRAEESIETATKNAGQVWYIIFARSIAEYHAAGQRTHPDLEYLDSNYNLKSVENWDGLQVYFYTEAP
jgi:4-amino-4-deoxy-L-arabinose transferase-like glycosyltransferase